MKDVQLEIMANPREWCSISWAAQTIGIDERSVRRLIEENRLHGFTPRLGAGESDRHKTMLHVPEVQRYAEARAVVSGRG